MAYYCLHEFHMTPSQFLGLSREERAFITAAVEVKAEEDKKREARMKKSRKR